MFSKSVDACWGRPEYVSSLEHVQARLTLLHNQRGKLAVHLVSPLGTRSTLLFPRYTVKHDTAHHLRTNQPSPHLHFSPPLFSFDVCKHSRLLCFFRPLCRKKNKFFLLIQRENNTNRFPPGQMISPPRDSTTGPS